VYPGLKWAGREGDLSPPSSAEVKIAWNYTTTPSYVMFLPYCRRDSSFDFLVSFYVHKFDKRSVLKSRSSELGRRVVMW
jgi:hypothetical protein